MLTNPQGANAPQTTQCMKIELIYKDTHIFSYIEKKMICFFCRGHNRLGAERNCEVWDKAYVWGRIQAGFRAKG